MPQPRPHLALVIIASLVTGLEGYVSVQLVQIPRDPLQQGDNAVIKCTAFGIESGDKVQLVKQIVTDDLEVSDVIIATNNYIEPLYSTFLNADGVYRYDIHFEEVADVIETQFNLEIIITGIEGDDGGYYRCKVGDKAITAYEYLTVNVPLSELYISHWLPNGTEERVSEGETVTLEPSVLTGVTCNGIIDGGHQDPILGVYVGGVDETDNFEQLAFDQLVPLENSTNTYHMIQWEKLVYQTPEPTRKYHDKTLRCEGYTQGYESDVRTATVQFIVKFIPDFVCEQYTFPTNAGDMVTIDCTLYANPSASLAFTYNPTGDPNSTSRIDVSGSLEQDGFTITLLEYNGAGIQNLTVGIPVTADSFSTEYRLIAENQYGLHTQRFYINQDFTSRGSQILSTSVTAIWCCILTLLAISWR